MALEISDHRAKQEAVGEVMVETTLYQTNTGEFVPAGDPEAMYLVVSEGQQISNERAEELGLIKKPTPKKAPAKRSSKRKSS